MEKIASSGTYDHVRPLSEKHLGEIPLRDHLIALHKTIEAGDHLPYGTLGLPRNTRDLRQYAESGKHSATGGAAGFLLGGATGGAFLPSVINMAREDFPSTAKYLPRVSPLGRLLGGIGLGTALGSYRYDRDKEAENRYLDYLAKKKARRNPG